MSDEKLATRDEIVEYAFNTISRLTESIRLLRTIKPGTEIPTDMMLNILLANSEGMLHAMRAVLVLELERERKELNRVIRPGGHN